MGRNTELVSNLAAQGKILTQDYITFWFYAGEILETTNNPDLATVDYYLAEANREYNQGKIFVDYQTYDQIYDMIVGGPIISLAEYETYGLVNIASYGYIENWDEVLDISMSFKGPPGLTAIIQSTIKATLELNGYTPLQIHVLASPGIKVLNLSLTADYKVRVYYHNPYQLIPIVIIIAALALLGIVYIITNTISKVSEDGVNRKKIEYTTLAIKSLEAMAADPTQPPEIRQAAARAMISSLPEVIKNIGLPKPETFSEQISKIGNTLLKVAIFGGIAYLAIQFLPILIPPAKEKLRQRLT